MQNTHSSPSPDVPEIPAGQDTIVEWSAPAEPAHARTARWYLIGTVLVLATVVWSVITGAWSLAIAAAIVGGIYFLLRREPPVTRHIAIGEQGFELNGKITYWSDCEGYWMIHTPAWNVLHIRKRHGPGRDVSIHTADIDPTALRAVLSRFLPVLKDRHESFVDVCIRVCKL